MVVPQADFEGTQKTENVTDNFQVTRLSTESFLENRKRVQRDDSKVIHGNSCELSVIVDDNCNCILGVHKTDLDVVERFQPSKRQVTGIVVHKESSVRKLVTTQVSRLTRVFWLT